MASKTREERLAEFDEKRKKLDAKKEQLDAQRSAFLQRLGPEERKKETRRKILIGGAIRAVLKQGENENWDKRQLQTLRTLLDKVLEVELVEDRDRELFGLSLRGKVENLVLKPKEAPLEASPTGTTPFGKEGVPALPKSPAGTTKTVSPYPSDLLA